ncbi:hypothetical protein CEK25_004977 [Fusarium fujikuroi]|nr:hypothetical protein CEK25_004977 [Fusarium fujikuroi]
MRIPLSTTKFSSELVVFQLIVDSDSGMEWVFDSGGNGPKWNDVVQAAAHQPLVELSTNKFQAGGTGAESIDCSAFSCRSSISGGQVSILINEAGDIFYYWRTGHSLINENVNRLFQRVQDYVPILANYLGQIPATYNSSAYNAVPSVQELFPALTKGLEANGLQQDYVNTPSVCQNRSDTCEGIQRHVFSDPEKRIGGACYTSEGVPRHLCSDPGMIFFVISPRYGARCML